MRSAVGLGPHLIWAPAMRASGSTWAADPLILAESGKRAPDEGVPDMSLTSARALSAIGTAVFALTTVTLVTATAVSGCGKDETVAGKADCSALGEVGSSPSCDSLCAVSNE